MNDEAQHELLTLAEAADLLRINPATLRLWALDDRVPHLRIGPKGFYRFRRADLEDFMTRPFSDTRFFHTQPDEAA